MIKNNEKATGEAFVILIFTSLLISTVLISYFLFAIYGLQVAYADIPKGQQDFSSEQNFTSDQINYTTLQTSHGEWVFVGGLGRVFVTHGLPLTSWSYLYINNIQKDSAGYVTNHYWINNTVKQPYTIVLKFTSTTDTSEITVNEHGLFLPTYWLNQVIGGTQLIDYPDMCKVENVEITTRYNEEQQNCEFIFNGQQFYLGNLGYPVRIQLKQIYGGVASNTVGFILKDFKTENQIAYNPDTDMFAQLSALLITMFKLIAWNIDEKYLPFYANLILIKTQTVTLFIAIIAMVRG